MTTAPARHRVFIGAGSNVEPLKHLRLAVRALSERFGSLALSSVYQNPPVGFTGDDFLNMVIAFDTAATVEDVAAVLKEIHERAGRIAGQQKFGPRTLDLDLLMLGAQVDPQRRVPRSDVLRYGFVLGPLAELAPDLKHPVTGVTMAEAWAAFSGPRQLRNLGVLARLARKDMTVEPASHS